MKSNVSVALQYLESWLRGSGAVAIYNLMEDTATAEISRAQLWQWLRHGADVDGERFSTAMYERVRDAEIAALSSAGGHTRLRDAAKLLDELVLGDDFAEFLTLPGERYLDGWRLRVPPGTRLEGVMTSTDFARQVRELEEEWGTMRAGRAFGASTRPRMS